MCHLDMMAKLEVLIDKYKDGQESLKTVRDFYEAHKEVLDEIDIAYLSKRLYGIVS